MWKGNIFLGIALLGSLLLIQTRGVVGRARLGRNDDTEPQNPNAELFNRDLNKLDKAIRKEIRAEEAHGIDPTPTNLEQDLVEHNQNKSWWKRLTTYLKTEFQVLLKNVLRRGLEEYIVPAIKKQFLL